MESYDARAYAEMMGAISDLTCAAKCVAQCTGCMCSCRCTCSCSCGKGKSHDIEWEEM